MAEAIYVSCAILSALCAFLLLREYRKTRTRLLLWSGICFGGLALNNALLVVDLMVFPQQVDLSLWRSAVALLAMMSLLFGFIWESH